MLLKIIEDFPEEFKVLAASALTHLFRDKEILKIYKQFSCSEKLIK